MVCDFSEVRFPKGLSGSSSLRSWSWYKAIHLHTYTSNAGQSHPQRTPATTPERRTSPGSVLRSLPRAVWRKSVPDINFTGFARKNRKKDERHQFQVSLLNFTWQTRTKLCSPMHMFSAIQHCCDSIHKYEENMSYKLNWSLSTKGRAFV